jgi:hypothetical protein
MLYRLTNRIFASVMVERLNYRSDLDLDPDLVRELREGRTRLQVRRLKQSADESIDLFVSPPICDQVADWCRRAPQIPQLIQRNPQLTTQTDTLQWSCGCSRWPRAWIEGLFAFVDQTGSPIVIIFWWCQPTVVNAIALFVE